MDTMVKEKDAAIEKAMGFEAETEELNKVCYPLEEIWVISFCIWAISYPWNASFDLPVLYSSAKIE